jgi:hypothetical protein
MDPWWFNMLDIKLLCHVLAIVITRRAVMACTKGVKGELRLQ